LRQAETSKGEPAGAVSYLMVDEINDYNDALTQAGVSIFIPKKQIPDSADSFFSYNSIPGHVMLGLYQGDPSKKALSQKEPAFGYFSHIDYYSDDVPATKAFYEKVFGWKLYTFPGYEDYPMFQPTPKLGGGITKRDEHVGKQHTVCYVHVKDIAATLHTLANHGGKKVKEVTNVPGFGKYAFVKIPGDIVLGVWQSHNPEVLPDEKRVKDEKIPGIGYVEFVTNDFKSTIAFLEKALSWKIRVSHDHGNVVTPSHPDIVGVGVRQKSKHEAPGFLTYLDVKNIDDIALAQKEGAKVELPKTAIPQSEDYYLHLSIPGGAWQGLFAGSSDPKKNHKSEKTNGCPDQVMTAAPEPFEKNGSSPSKKQKTH